MKSIPDILKTFLAAVLSAALLSCSVQLVDRSSVKSSERMRGVYHRVKPGETLWRISKAYNVDLQELAEINNITDASRISAGSVVFIPDAPEVIDLPPARPAEAKPPVARAPERTAPAQPDNGHAAGSATVSSAGSAAAAGKGKIREESITDRAPAPRPERSPGPPARPPEKAQPKPQEKADAAVSSSGKTQVAMQPPAPAPPVKTPDAALKDRPAVTPAAKKPEPAPKAEETQGQIKVDKGRFAWPLRGPVITRFGIQPSGMKYNGIKIAAKENAPVQAAAAGTVIYASTVKGYGETVIVKHDENYTTVYAYLKNTVAKRDEKIRKGEKIASVGPPQEPGGESYLYFEIREKNKARNPLFFLP
ncbi:MAG: peptidoglycan DD-metalloendopeptidase family protein [Syntrophaceae bacterium]|nr:peptidoglycan DD-metalloendopeptidase family protein [Syntrophaceae bacterium]